MTGVSWIFACCREMYSTCQILHRWLFHCMCCFGYLIVCPSSTWHSLSSAIASTAWISRTSHLSVWQVSHSWAVVVNMQHWFMLYRDSFFFFLNLVLVFVDHFLWFNYFTTHYKPFMDIAAFFGLCVWLVPFAYFISLSANDNALPTSGKSSKVESKVM